MRRLSSRQASSATLRGIRIHFLFAVILVFTIMGNLVYVRVHNGDGQQLQTTYEARTDKAIATVHDPDKSEEYGHTKLSVVTENFLLNHEVNAIDLAGFGLQHLHNVCLQGGENGLVVPHLADSFRSGGAFDRETYSQENLRPAGYRTYRFEETIALFGTAEHRRRYNITSLGGTIVTGPTYFMNCWRRQPEDTNPTHWLMKMVKLFELSVIMGRLNADGKVHNQILLPKLENLALHQCTSYSKMIASGHWQWGRHIFDAATRYWKNIGKWKVEDTNVLELNQGNSSWVCFEDLYMEIEYGTWYPKQSDAQALWQEALLSDKNVHSQIKVPSNDTLRERCDAKRLRIHIFQRTEGKGLRSFLNLNETLELVHEYTSNASVSIITLNSSTTIVEQIKTFRGFDVLVTPHGSHLANIIFRDPGSTAIVEVTPVVRDASFLDNARRANFSSYIVSTGHEPSSTGDESPICRDGRTQMWKKCSQRASTDMWECPWGLRTNITVCDIVVNLSILRSHLNKAVNDLCQ